MAAYCKLNIQHICFSYQKVDKRAGYCRYAHTIKAKNDLTYLGRLSNIFRLLNIQAQ